jgi:hypothetical protein
LFTFAPSLTTKGNNMKETNFFDQLSLEQRQVFTNFGRCLFTRTYGDIAHADVAYTVRLPQEDWDIALDLARLIIQEETADFDGKQISTRIEGHSDIGRSITAICPNGCVTLIILHSLDAQ